MGSILIIGGTSAIAESTARLFAGRGDGLYLIARSDERLANISKDLKIRGAASVNTGLLDVNHFELHESAVDQAFEVSGPFDVVLIAHGVLPDQVACENDADTAMAAFNVNAMSVVSLLTTIANRMEKQKSGTIAVITSVAGERGRRSNYVYGAAKGMVQLFLQGLRSRLQGAGVAVIDIRPGFVDTPMTAEFTKGPLWAKPEAIASGILSAIDRSKTHVYLPWFWRYIILIIKLIPEKLFMRLKI